MGAPAGDGAVGPQPTRMIAADSDGAECPAGLSYFNRSAPACAAPLNSALRVCPHTLLRGGLGGRRWPLLRGSPASANLGSEYRQILDICSGNYWIMFSATVLHGIAAGGSAPMSSSSSTGMRSRSPIARLVRESCARFWNRVRRERVKSSTSRPPPVMPVSTSGPPSAETRDFRVSLRPSSVI